MEEARVMCLTRYVSVLVSVRLGSIRFVRFFCCGQVLGQAATSTSEDFQPNSLAGFAAQAVTYVLGLGLFPMYLDGKQAAPRFPSHTGNRRAHHAREGGMQIGLDWGGRARLFRPSCTHCLPGVLLISPSCQLVDGDIFLDGALDASKHTPGHGPMFALFG